MSLYRVPSCAWDEGISWYRTIVSRPDDPPIDDALVCAHLNIAAIPADRVDYLKTLVNTAWGEAERVTQRALTRQQATLSLSGFPSGNAIEFPSPPFVSLDGVDYLDEDGATQVWGGSPAAWQVQGIGALRQRGRLALVPSGSWPSVGSGYVSPVVITYTCGYAYGEVPSEIIHGMLLMIGELYKLRTETVQGVSSTQAYVTARALWEGWRSY